MINANLYTHTPLKCIGKFKITLSNDKLKLYKNNRSYSILYNNIIYYKQYKSYIVIKFHKSSIHKSSINKLSVTIISLKINNKKNRNNIITMLSIKQKQYINCIYNPIHTIKDNLVSTKKTINSHW